LGSVMT